MTRAAQTERPGVLLTCAILTGIGVALFAVRLTAPTNLMDNEYRVGARVLDALQNHDWICPIDSIGNPDKPPMLTWLAALASLPSGRVSAFTLYLPNALSTLVIACLLAVVGRRELGGRAGFFAGLGYLLCDVGARQMATARFDGLFALTVMLTALAAFHAWMRGGGWTWFWLAAAVATLTKGPLGLLLATFGLLAVVWERRSGTPKPLRGSQLPGLVGYLVLTVGWFALAYRQLGPHLVDNLIVGEFVGHVVEHGLGRRFLTPIFDFLTNFAPWSILTVVGLVRICRAPAGSDRERRFERFLFCWFVGGLLVFCISPHNPSRLMYPVVPAAAAIAGRELDRLTRQWSGTAVVRGAAVASGLALAIFTFQYQRLERKKPAIRKTIAIESLVRTVRGRVGDAFPLTYTADCPYAVQLGFNTLRAAVSYADAATLLRGDAPAFVVVTSAPRLRQVLSPDGPALYEVASVRDGNVPYLSILSNHPTLEWVDPVAARMGPFVVRLEGVRLSRATAHELVLSRGTRGGAATVTNASESPAPLRVLGEGTDVGHHDGVLGAGERWRVDVP
jgi:4-amino-4-deoxy-L-arabinose transferase-like glycosyltransferase